MSYLPTQLSSALIPTVAAMLVGMALAAPAAADIRPPNQRQVAETCTLERMEPGRTCVLCEGAYHGDQQHCVNRFVGTDMTRACRTRGASVWQEIWCAGEGTQTPTPGAVAPTTAPSDEEAAAAAEIAAMFGAPGANEGSAAPVPSNEVPPTAEADPAPTAGTAPEGSGAPAPTAAAAGSSGSAGEGSGRGCSAASVSSPAPPAAGLGGLLLGLALLRRRR